MAPLRHHLGSCRLRRVAAAAAVLLLYTRLFGHQRTAAPSPRAWVPSARLCGVWPAGPGGCPGRPSTVPVRAASTAPPVEAIEVAFDPNSAVDMAEKKLVGTTFALTSSVFGFPNFRSLIDLRGDGTVYFWGGMVSKAVGGWSVEEGDPNEGERPDDLYLQFTQPLTDRYATIFTVPGKVCFWRGKLEFRGGGKTKETVHVEGGQVCSERDGKDLIREGVFTAVSVDEAGALEIQKKSAEAFERALTTPKAESSGFKTPARIAGLNTRRPGRQLTAGKKDDVELEDD